MNMCPEPRETESLNYKAYDDVSRALPPSMPEDSIYMSRYSFWRAMAGEAHFSANQDDHS